MVPNSYPKNSFGDFSGWAIVLKFTVKEKNRASFISNFILIKKYDLLSSFKVKLLQFIQN